MMLGIVSASDKLDAATSPLHGCFYWSIAARMLHSLHWLCALEASWLKAASVKCYFCLKAPNPYLFY